MNVAPWVKYKTYPGKNICKFALLNDCYFDSMDCDLIAENNPDFFNLSDSEKIALLKNGFPAVPKENKPKRGRPTKSQDGKTSHEIRNELLRVKNGKQFPADVVEKHKNDIEVLTDNELYIELLKDTILKVKNDFFSNNPDLVKKIPSYWFKYLCNEIKKASPLSMYKDNISLISDIWDVYSDLCLTIGINRTIEYFTIFSGIPYSTIEVIKKGSSPEYIGLSKKIYSQCKDDITGGLSTIYGSSPNYMFIAKSIYGVVENTVVTHVSAASDNKNVLDIPCFTDSDSKE